MVLLLFHIEWFMVHSLIVFDELVKSEQTPVPAPTVLGLQVQVNLVHYARPPSRKIMFYYGTQTYCQLSPVN